MLPHKNDREALRKQRLEVLKCPPETGFRFAPWFDGSSTVGARMARPLALGVQGSPPTAVGVGRHAHMPPRPGASTASLAKVVPGYGRAMRAPTACAFGGGASDAVRHGRI